MEKKGLLHGTAGDESRSVIFPRLRSSSGNDRPRQRHAYSYDTIPDVEATISKDLMNKAHRWGQLAKGLLPSVTLNGLIPRQIPEEEVLVVDDNVSPHEIAAFYIKDALAGRETVACVHGVHSFAALKQQQNKTWNQLINVVNLVHLALPMLEVPMCLPCVGLQPLPVVDNSLWDGWQLTILGTMWLEVCFLLLYSYDMYIVYLSRRHTHKSVRGDRVDEEDRAGIIRHYFGKAPPWHIARLCMVLFLATGLLSNLVCHYAFQMTFHRWSRVAVPFLFISRRTYLKHFFGGLVRILPRMLPVVFLVLMVIFYYAFLGYLLYRNDVPKEGVLDSLDFFDTPLSSVQMFLRMFMSIPFMLDMEEVYTGYKGIRALGMSFGVIVVLFLGALVPAVANRNFKKQSLESFMWVSRMRQIAINRAHRLIQQEDGTVQKEDYVIVMSYLRPELDKAQVTSLFEAAVKSDPSSDQAGMENLSKEGFFMICALSKADFMQEGVEFKEWIKSSKCGRWASFRHKVDGIMSCRIKLFWVTPRVSRVVYDVAVVVQAYQMMREGDPMEEEEEVSFVHSLGLWLIVYFWVNATARMIAEGARRYLSGWRHTLGMWLNIAGLVYYLGAWPPGETATFWFEIMQSSRVLVLWQMLHRMGGSTAEVAKRLQLVFPAVLRSGYVLLAVVYAFSILAYSFYCNTPLGVGDLSDVEGEPMMRRWISNQDAYSFATLPLTFLTMTDMAIMASWPNVMDAAGAVTDVESASAFFYFYRILCFYFVAPVMLGFIVSSYMTAQIREEAPQAAGTPGRPTLRRDSINGDGASRGSRDLMEPVPRRRSSLESVRSGSDISDIPIEEEPRVDGIGELNKEEDKDEGEEEEARSPAPLLVTSNTRSMSTAYWGEQQDQLQKGKESEDLHETVERLEGELESYKSMMGLLEGKLRQSQGNLAQALLDPEVVSLTSSLPGPSLGQVGRSSPTQSVGRVSPPPLGSGRVDQWATFPSVSASHDTTRERSDSKTLSTRQHSSSKTMTPIVEMPGNDNDEEV